MDIGDTVEDPTRKWAARMSYSVLGRNERASDLRSHPTLVPFRPRLTVDMPTYRVAPVWEERVWTETRQEDRGLLVDPVSSSGILGRYYLVSSDVRQLNQRRWAGEGERPGTLQLHLSQ